MRSKIRKPTQMQNNKLYCYKNKKNEFHSILFKDDEFLFVAK